MYRSKGQHNEGVSARLTAPETSWLLGQKGVLPRPQRGTQSGTRSCQVLDLALDLDEIGIRQKCSLSHLSQRFMSLHSIRFHRICIVESPISL